MRAQVRERGSERQRERGRAGERGRVGERGKRPFCHSKPPRISYLDINILI